MASKTPRGKVTAKGQEYADARGLSKNQVKGLHDSDIEGLEVVEDHTEEAIAALEFEYQSECHCAKTNCNNLKGLL